MASHILVIDQGTTSTRSIVFDRDMEPVGSAQEEFPQIYPHPGWVEHNPETLWGTALGTARAALARSNLAASDIAAIGIANQRETTLIWERASGRPIANAIVWQDRAPASASIPLSPRRRAAGCSTTRRAHARGRRPAPSRSAPWTASCSGA